MTEREQFRKLYEQVIEHAKQTQFEKNEKYAYENDVLYNFKFQAHWSEKAVEEEIWSGAGKQVAGMRRALNQLLYEAQTDAEFEEAVEYIRVEKIPDIINYLLLLLFRLELRKARIEAQTVADLSSVQSFESAEDSSQETEQVNFSEDALGENTWLDKLISKKEVNENE